MFHHLLTSLPPTPPPLLPLLYSDEAAGIVGPRKIPKGALTGRQLFEQGKLKEDVTTTTAIDEDVEEVDYKKREVMEAESDDDEEWHAGSEEESDDDDSSDNGGNGGGRHLFEE